VQLEELFVVNKPSFHQELFAPIVKNGLAIIQANMPKPVNDQIIEIENNFAFPDQIIGLPSSDDSNEDIMNMPMPKLIPSPVSIDPEIKLIDY